MGERRGKRGQVKKREGEKEGMGERGNGKKREGEFIYEIQANLVLATFYN